MKEKTITAKAIAEFEEHLILEEKSRRPLRSISVM